MHLCFFFLLLLHKNVESSGVLTFFMSFPIIFKKVFKFLGKIISKKFSVIFPRLHDVIKYVLIYHLLISFAEEPYER